jgi:hypothetical protein
LFPPSETDVHDLCADTTGNSKIHLELIVLRETVARTIFRDTQQSWRQTLRSPTQATRQTGGSIPANLELSPACIEDTIRNIDSGAAAYFPSGGMNVSESHRTLSPGRDWALGREGTVN